MENRFITRLYRIPLVSAAVDHVESLYSRSKDRHPIIRLACEAAEFGLQVAVVSAQPVLDRLEQPSKSWHNNYLSNVYRHVNCYCLNLNVCMLLFPVFP
jgi:Perilipin family